MPLLFAQYSGGSGTASDPYLIANKSDLHSLSTAISWGYYFKQIDDIYLSNSDFANGGIFYNNGLGFKPIGTHILNAFNGVYDGNWHKIDGLYINRDSEDNIGLFGCLRGKVMNLGVTNVNVTGYNYTGALVGLFSAVDSVNNCYATGSVHGVGGDHGGLIGWISTGYVNSCYADVDVSGFYVGGFVGANHGTIKNCYAIGSVSGSPKGGFVREQNYGYIQNCYSASSGNGFSSQSSYDFLNCFWDSDLSGPYGGGAEAIGKSTAEMQTKSTFTNVGWDFVNTWKMGNCATNNGYPVLKWQTLNNLPQINVNVFSSDAFITAVASGYNYQWFNCDNQSIISGETNQSYTAITNGNYAVIVESGSCTDTSECVSITGLGIGNNIKLSNTMPYPNPTTGFISIDLLKSDIYNVSIYNSFGQELSKIQVNSNKLDLNINTTVGIYFIKVCNNYSCQSFSVLKE